MATAEKHQLVTVTVTITDADGNTTTKELSIPGRPTDVPALKHELGIADEDSLWFVKAGKKKLLADHEKHNVKEHDHFEVVSKGGVS